MKKFPTLYSRASNGAIRQWYMVLLPNNDTSAYRSVSGLHPDGTLTESGIIYAKPKNVGKKNETTAQDQAILEIEAEYKKKKKENYFESPDDVDSSRRVFEPMLAQPLADVKKKGKPIDFSRGAYIQPKLDGIRAPSTNYGMFSRNGREITAMPHIEQVLTDLPNGVTLDGELYNHAMKEDFNQIVSIVKKQKPTSEDLQESLLISLYVYDLYDGTDKPFSERFQMLVDIVNELDPDHMVLVPVDTRPVSNLESVEAHFAAHIEQGYEGSMLRLDAPYEAGKRSKTLLKVKEFEDAEYPIVSIEEGSGNWAGRAKRVIFRLPDGTTSDGGIKGNYEFTEKLLMEKDSYKTVTIRYQNLTPDGKPRFAVGIKFWKDEKE